MRTLIGSDELSTFRRCRRAWELGSPSRRNLEPIDSAPAPDAASAILEALAVYYFPGMWDWDRAIVERLTMERLARSLPGDPAELALAERALTSYFGWAPTVDSFAPIRVMTDYEARISHPDAADQAVLDAGGMPVDFGGRVDLFVADGADRYWLIRHRVSRESWANQEALRLDDYDVADCWGWQAFHPGLTVVGTVTNELRLDAAGAPPVPSAAPAPRVDQHAPSGGGRSIPYHRRIQVATTEPAEPIRIDEYGAFRRTWLARGQAEIEAVGVRIGAIALDMLDPSLRLYPNPSAAHCPDCPFQAPCAVMSEGRSAETLLADGYCARQRPAVEAGRLGAVTWGVGRGAAPAAWDEPSSRRPDD